MHMYVQHFNLNLLPFENVPDPIFFMIRAIMLVSRRFPVLYKAGAVLCRHRPIGSGKTTF